MKNYKEPKIEIIRLTEADIITTSGDYDDDNYKKIIEGEMVGKI